MEKLKVKIDQLNVKIILIEKGKKCLYDKKETYKKTLEILSNKKLLLEKVFIYF